MHVFPYWDFNEGQNIDVQVCSNAPEVELFVNGKSMGRHKIDHVHGRNQTGRWLVPYEKGEIAAAAYDLSGREIARKTRHSFSDAVQITASADKYEMCGNGQDLIFVEIGALDEQGYPVENANNRMQVEVRGAGRIVLNCRSYQSLNPVQIRFASDISSIQVVEAALILTGFNFILKSNTLQKAAGHHINYINWKERT